jgi:hypothetical protein
MMKRQILQATKDYHSTFVSRAKLLILQLGAEKLGWMKKTDSFYSKFESKSLPKDVDGRSRPHIESSLNVG